MTCCHDGYEHAVTDEAMTAGYRHRRGVYGGMCGHAVTAQALVAPPGPRCPHCIECIETLHGRRVPRMETRWRGWLRNVFLKGKDIT
jgi:hypothetical protein